MFELLFLSGVRAGAVVAVEHSLIAGRDPDCSLEVPDPRVSRRHARVEWDGVQCQLIDTHSSNGTFVNDQPVQTKALQPGDVLRMGSTQLRVQQRRNSLLRTTAHHSVFGFRDAREPEMAHAVPMTGLDQTAAADVAGLRQRLASMLQVSEMLAAAKTLDELCAPVLDTLLKLLPQTDRAFLLLGERADRLEPRAVRLASNRPVGKLAVSRSICRAALEKRAALVYREGSDEPLDASRSVIDLAIRSALAVPLIVGAEVLGLVMLDTRDPGRAYGQRDLELAAAVCHQVAIAVRNAHLLKEIEQQTATRNNLMRFLPKTMADQVLAGEIDAGLGGKRYRGSVLFSDVIGFTARAEQMAPDELVTYMNRYFNAVVPSIEREGGSIDKFMGDAVMAVWGIPIEPGDSAQRAVAAALAMQIGLATFNSEQEEPLPMGIGVHTGEVVAGNIGTDSRREYTVLGDPVNTAQRIGSAACLEQVLVGDATWAEISGHAFGVRMPPLTAKNKSLPLQTFSVRGLAAGDEIQLLVPVRLQDGNGWLIRRLADTTFLLLYEPSVLSSLTVRAVELPAIALGVPSAVTELPSEAGDCALRRARIRLDDPSLGGLLVDRAFACPRSWLEMDRNATARPVAQPPAAG